MSFFNKWSSLVKLSHTLFSLPFALIGLGYAYLQQSNVSIRADLFLMLLAILFARNAAMAFNRYIDRDIDAKNSRTQNREIPSKKISPERALVFVIVNIFLFLITAYIINPLAFYLSPIAITVIIGYSYSKRFTWLCHYVLGLGLAIAPVGAYIVIVERIDFLPVLLSIAVFFWVGGFDILYSLQDEEFDIDEKLHSIPQRFGRKNALIISAISHLFTILTLLLFGYFAEVTWVYWIGFALFSGILIWEHVIVKPNDIRKINLAFATLNASGSVIFAIFTLIDAFRYYYL